MPTKKIYYNADVITMNPDAPEASAFGILGDRLAMVGTEEQIRSWAGSNAEQFDLKGKTVVPGFLETHNHLSWYSARLEQVDCSPSITRTIEEVKAAIKNKADQTGPGEWIIAHSYDDTLIEDNRHITRYELDEAAPDNPVFLFHASGHLGYANSWLLDRAGIGPDTPQPDGGEIRKDEDGIPTGLLLEPGAMLLVMKDMPKYTVDHLKDLLKQGVAYAQSHGVTGVHDAAIGGTGPGPEVVQAYRELADEGLIGCRVYMTIMYYVFDSFQNLGLGSGFGDEWVKIGSVKLLQDGSIQGWTAALTEPYFDRKEDGFTGHFIMPQEEMDALVEKYHRAGFQVAIHTNGDRAIDSVLLAVERAQEKHYRPDPRHMLIHAQTARPDQIDRMLKAGVIPSYFVNHVYYWGDRHASTFLGPERAARISPLKTSLDAGLKFTLHSDLPITPISPIESIHNAVNRKTRNGQILGPEERISPLDALKAFTTWGAYSSFEEDLKGSLEPGKLADFVVLSDNPLKVEPENIKDIKVLETVIGGQTSYRAE